MFLRKLLFFWTLFCLGFYLSFPPVKVTGVASNPLTLDRSLQKQTVTGTVELGRPGIGGWHLRADDCITKILIDGKSTYEGECGGCKHCDRKFFPFPPGLSAGPHRFEIEVGNLVDQVYVEWALSDYLLFEATFLWLFGLALLFLGERWGLRRPISAILLVGMVISTLYVDRTGPKERSYDTWGHVDYIKYVIDQGKLPKVDSGWEMYQPPVYYLSAVAWIPLFRVFYPNAPGEAAVQRLAWFAFLATLLVAAFCWAEFEKRLKRPLPWVGAVLIAGLPAHVFLAARVNNDVFLPLLGALVLAGTLSVQKRAGWMLATLSGALIVWTKLSGLSVLLFAPVALYLAGGWNLKTLKRVAWVSLAPALAVCGWEVVNLIDTHQLFYDRLWNMDENLKVPNSAYRWLSFDLWGYLSSPAADSREGPIRLSLPTFLLTSALQGEFRVLPDRIALLTFLRAAFLPLAASLPLAVAFQRQKLLKKKEWLLLGVPFGVALFLFVFYNVKGSFSSAQDFRFLAPMFVPLGFLLSLSVEELSRKRAWHLALTCCSWAFSGLLVVYFYLLTTN